MLRNAGADSVGMRAMVKCGVCGSPIAGVDTIGDQASTETDIEDCPDHPEAAYTLSVERL